MAEVQDRHRKVATLRYGSHGLHEQSMETICKCRPCSVIAQVLADQEAEIADALRDEALPGQDPWTLAAWVRSGEWISE